MDILGEGFNQVILDQIDARQKIFAAGYNSNNPRTPEFITYATSATSFVQLMSSVEIADPKKLNSPFVATLNKTGQALAKDAILFGGVKGLKSGIPDKKISSPFNNYAYGWGAGDFGLRPMPGITTANIKTENIGSLKTATVNIKCWDRAQFEIIETLYLRLGFYVLLEWGHTIYTNNGSNPTIIKDPLSLETEFFSQKNSIDDMLSLIVKKRLEGFGNYDALFGKVVNFSWNFNNDGSYDIIITIRSVGDIIESLKVNIFTSDTGAITLTTEEEENNITNNTIASTAVGSTQVNTYYINQVTGTTPTSTIPIDPEAFKSNINFRLYSLKNDLDNRVNKNNFLKDDNVFGISTYLSDGNLQDVVKVIWNNKTSTYYIRFGALLRIIQGDVIPTINGNGKKDKKALKIDYNVESNLINYLDYQVSTNPQYVLIKKEIKFDDENIQILNKKCADFEKSIDGVSTYGKLMNAYLSYEFIKTKLDELRLTPGSKVLLIDFFQAIGKTISDCLGGINNIVPIIDEETNTVKFIDQNLLYKKDSVIAEFNKTYKTQTSTTPGKFEIYGYNPSGSNGSGSAGFVKDMTMKTELTPQFASMITIGAAARSKVVGEDATALSRINAGLTSSYIEEYNDPRIIPTTATTSSVIEQYKKSLEQYKQFLISMNMSDDSKPPQWDETNFKSYSNALNSFITFAQNITFELSGSASTSTGFIPINVSLRMTGMSGMKIYQEFTVDTKYLPSNYSREMSFLIKGINHTIQNNMWSTTIESLSLPKITNKPIPLFAIINLVKETKDFNQDNIKIAVQFFRRQGFTNEQTAGILGNFIQESGLNPSIVGYGVGIAQWLGPRRLELEKQANYQSSLLTQLDFVVKELTDRKLYKTADGKGYDASLTNARTKLFNVKTTPGSEKAAVKEATLVWLQYYERALGQEETERVGYALDIYQKIKDGKYN
jgi:hypothetical protein